MTPTRANPPKPPKKRPECCRKWDEVPPADRARWEWQTVHTFAHQRTTFSVATLADWARVDERRAADLISRAQEMKWIWTPSDGVWVGQLTARR